ncbi:carbon storage regulator [Mariniblastus fucicola]|uniref:Translational regulator CsrA n=1 Tax=Mariniblastus fucicola TaxID=980251 RepID=A0A5B9PHQ0_9BACT|nr:carbon storage regulator [Mariniblastus fucicola]QEG25129.1 hypothetical protein MFFC18_50520 [Mariniblastus fucicola]
MLVLSRHVDESIVIPELGITIEVTRIKGKTVRLGIKAPESIRILRGELESVVNEFEEPAAPRSNRSIAAPATMGSATQSFASVR